MKVITISAISVNLICNSKLSLNYLISKTVFLFLLKTVEIGIFQVQKFDFFEKFQEKLIGKLLPMRKSR